MLTKKQMQVCINSEIYKGIDHLKFIDKIWCKLFRPQSRVILHIRKMQYYNGRINILSKYHQLILNSKYGIYINANAEIGEGLYMPHPTSICCTNVRIGKNFTIFQNSTIGSKRLGETDVSETPHIGDNVTIYANSAVIGNVHVADNVIVGCGAIVIHNCEEVGGIYIGSPAKIKINEELL